MRFLRGLGGVFRHEGGKYCAAGAGSAFTRALSCIGCAFGFTFADGIGRTTVLSVRACALDGPAVASLGIRIVCCFDALL